jgi:hypothetical protein
MGSPDRHTTSIIFGPMLGKGRHSLIGAQKVLHKLSLPVKGSGVQRDKYLAHSRPGRFVDFVLPDPVQEVRVCGFVPR